MFWVPLALMWLIMGIEQPALNAVMARLPDATRNLAAFEIAFALALVIESPILQMLSAATALINGPRSYRRLVRFMGGWAILLSTVHFVLSRPGVFAFVTGRLLAAPPELIEPARSVFIWLVPFAALVGFRRLWQGALIRAGYTGRVGWTMVVRLVLTLGGLALGMALRAAGVPWAPEGHHVAVVSLMAGVAGGAAAALIAHRRPIRSWFDTVSAVDEEWSPGRLLAFYLPLSLTSIMALASRPLLAFGMNRSALPVLSLAAWPSVQGYLFLYSSISLSYQEAVVAKTADGEDALPLLRRFAVVLGGALSGLYLLIVLTRGLPVWFDVVAGLAPELATLAVTGATIVMVLPAVMTARSYLSGVLVARHVTRPLALAVALNVIVLFLLVYLLPVLTDLAGVRVAGTAFVVANVVQVGALFFARR